MYLSYDTMLVLVILNNNFPKVAMFSNPQKIGNKCSENKKVTKQDSNGMICGAIKEVEEYVSVLSRYLYLTGQFNIVQDTIHYDRDLIDLLSMFTWRGWYTLRP